VPTVPPPGGSKCHRGSLPTLSLDHPAIAPLVRFVVRPASPKICEIQFNTITLIAGKCSPTRFFDSCPGFLAKLYIFLMMHGIFTVKHVQQDLVAEMKPHPAELGFASP
jgi:hypothetical protein